MIFSSEITGWHNRTRPPKGALNRKIRERQLRSGVNLQEALNQNGVKQTGVIQGFGVHKTRFSKGFLGQPLIHQSVSYCHLKLGSLR